jgi:hypothetical protein
MKIIGHLTLDARREAARIRRTEPDDAWRRNTLGRLFSVTGVEGMSLCRSGGQATLLPSLRSAGAMQERCWQPGPDRPDRLGRFYGNRACSAEHLAWENEKPRQLATSYETIKLACPDGNRRPRSSIRCILTKSGALTAFLCLALKAYAFPIDQFKEFINSKPTIEVCDFRVLTRTIQEPGFPTNTYRSFNVVYENDTKYRLIQDKRGIIYESRTLHTASGNVLIVEPYTPPITLECWSRFEDTFWSTFNPNGVLTTRLDPETPHPTFGPIRLAQLRMGIAYNAFNLGVVGLRTNGVIWAGQKFTCRANDHGAGIEGELQIGKDGIPMGLIYTLTKNKQKYHYRVIYEFAQRQELPDFFPSRIRIETVKDSHGRIVSDYKIDRLRLSDRTLTIDDVVFVPNVRTNLAAKVLTNKHDQVVIVPPRTNLVHYMYSNDNLYRVDATSSESNQLVRIRNASEAMSSSFPWQREKGLILLAMVVVTALPMLSLYLAKKPRK